MEKVIIAVGAIGVFLLILFIAAIGGAALGAFSGWIVQFVFPTTFGNLAALTGFKVYQMGAIAGFFGGFFRATVTQKSS